MFASTGDNGVGCPVLLATGVPNSGVPEVCYPAASPYVVAVGGTTLDTNANGNEPGTYYGEHVWVGTGGGVSKWETAPYWQTNGICTLCTAGTGIADISMCADNNGCPMDVFVSGAKPGSEVRASLRRCRWEYGRACKPTSTISWDSRLPFFTASTAITNPVRWDRRVAYRRESLATTPPLSHLTRPLRSADSTTSSSAQTASRVPQRRDGISPRDLVALTTTSCSRTSRTRSSPVPRSERRRPRRRRHHAASSSTSRARLRTDSYGIFVI